MRAAVRAVLVATWLTFAPSVVWRSTGDPGPAIVLLVGDPVIALVPRRLREPVP